MANFLKTLRNHWKKSIFFGIVVPSFGGNFLYKKYNEDLLIREYCAKALEYGEETITLNQRPRRIIVFLNPAASRGDSTKLFEKTAGPILHLAGLEVNIVKTEYAGQVKEYLSVLKRSEADGIVVAGGDGTLLETVTALMKKEDETLRLHVPVGVIPLGKTNRFAQLLFGSDLTKVKSIAESALAVVKGLGRRVDVLKIQGDDGRSTFAVCGLQTGAFMDSEVRKAKYWYFGRLKNYFTYIRTAMMDWPPVMNVKLTYKLATEENTKIKDYKPPVPELPKRSWMNIFYRPKPIPPKEEVRNEDYVDDEDEEVECDISTVEFSAMSTALQDQSQPIKAVEMMLGPSNPSKSDFIQEGWNRYKSETLRCGSETNESSLVKKVKVVPEIPEGKEMWYYIDGEAYEAMPVEIELLRKRIKVFCHEPEFKVK